MKRVISWARAIALVAFIIDWAFAGLKLLDGDYDITIEVYIAMVCFVVLLICAVCMLFTNKCPHCGRLRLTNGRYCPNCGKEI